MDFLSAIIEWDTELLLAIQSVHNPFWDRVMTAISSRAIWIPLYALLLFLLYKKYQRLVWKPVLVLVIGIILSDIIASWVFKPTIKRLRPGHEPALAEKVHLVAGHRGGTYGFFSSHASTTFTIAMFLTLVFRSWAFLLLLWAALVSFSRIYLGLHYPGDVLAGAFCGVFIGFLAYRIYLRLKGVETFVSR